MQGMAAGIWQGGPPAEFVVALFSTMRMTPNQLYSPELTRLPSCKERIVSWLLLFMPGVPVECYRRRHLGCDTV
jgi:hypothetical protein